MTSKRSVYMKTCLSPRISLKDWRIFFLSRKRSNIFKYYSTCQTGTYYFKVKNAIGTFVSFVLYTLFAPVILTSIHCCVNNSHDIKVPMKVIKTETSNVDFTSQ